MAHRSSHTSKPRRAWRRPLVATLLACAVGAASPALGDLDYPIPIHRDNGLANVFDKLDGGGSAAIAYIGGSVTEGWGWRDLVTDWFEARYPGRITEINAGWGGTGSLIGAMRFARDVLAQQPDLVFIEFAVNDLPEDPILFIERNSEGMVRQAWTQDPMTDVCFIETIASYIEQPYLQGYYPTTVQAHYNVCDHYGNPSVNVGWALYEHVLGGTSWESLTINGDRVHPNAAGSQIYADAVTAYLESERTRNGSPAAHVMPTPLTDYPVTGSTIAELADVTPLPPGWTIHQNEFGVARFVQSNTAGSQISVPFTGPAAALKLILGPDDGSLSASFDGGSFQGLGLADAGNYFVWALPIAKTLSFAAHTATIRVDWPIARLINIESPTSQTGGPGPGDVNLARTAVAQAADSTYGAGWGPDKARDGLTGTKWTSTAASQEHWLAFDFGAHADVSCFIVRHASTGGEPSYYNTQTFTVESGSSLTGPWTTEFTGSNPHQLGVSTFCYPSPASLRYVRLHITDPGIDAYARIPEFEVWGTIPPAPGDMDLDDDVDQSDFGLFQACYSGSGNPQTLPACERALLDTDDDVDLDDFAIFQACMSGPGTPLPPGCPH